jgi:hypothetical protein
MICLTVFDSVRLVPKDAGVHRDDDPMPLCVPKSKSERIDDEVRPVWRANL